MFQAPPFQSGAFDEPLALDGGAHPAFQADAFQAAIVGRSVEQAFQAEVGVSGEEPAAEGLRIMFWGVPATSRRAWRPPVDDEELEEEVLLA